MRQDFWNDTQRLLTKLKYNMIIKKKMNSCNKE